MLPQPPMMMQSEIWNWIVKDRNYFDQMTKDGIKIALIGADLQFIQNEEYPDFKDLIVALV